MKRSAELFALALALSSLVLVKGYQIEPGIGFVHKRTGEHVVVFEHTDYGTGALCVNRPTPVRLQDLDIPRFRDTFAANSLMLGCGIESSTAPEGNIRMGDMAPWFWLHNVPDLEGSFRLKAAKGLLFMGGNIETATELFKQKKLDPDRYKFKFFWKYKGWEGSKLKDEIAAGVWQQIEPQDPDEVLQP